MSKLLQEAFTMVSMRYSQHEQDRFAQLIMDNISKLREFLEGESEEQSFDNIAVRTVKSEKIRNLFGKVAEKYKKRNNEANPYHRKLS